MAPGICLIVTILLLNPACGSSSVAPTPKPQADLATLHNPLDVLCKKYVSDGLIDYRAWKNAPVDVQALDSYLNSLSELRPENFENSGDRNAFWVNAYNALAIKLVLQRYPLKSVIDDWHSDQAEPPKDFFTEAKQKIGSVNVSLDDIEKERAGTDRNPLLHFALVFPALSAPDAQAFAYHGATFDQEIERSTRAFVANEKKGVRIDEATRKLYLSEIFKEHRLEFEDGLRGFLSRYATSEQRRLMSDLNLVPANAEFMPLDWDLNDLPEKGKSGQPASTAKR